jgi:hypothetical protein
MRSLRGTALLARAAALPVLVIIQSCTCTHVITSNVFGDVHSSCKHPTLLATYALTPLLLRCSTCVCTQLPHRCGL